MSASVKVECWKLVPGCHAEKRSGYLVHAFAKEVQCFSTSHREAFTSDRGGYNGVELILLFFSMDKQIKVGQSLNQMLGSGDTCTKLSSNMANGAGSHSTERKSARICDSERLPVRSGRVPG